jgi:hypothetical protein
MMPQAGRSLTDPLGLNHSALAKTWTRLVFLSDKVTNGSSGVLPTSEGIPSSSDILFTYGIKSCI